MDRICKSLQKQRVDAEELERELAQLSDQGKLKINGETKKGQGLLQLAISTNDKEIVDVILKQKGIDANRADSDSRWTPLIYAISTSADKEIIKQLLKCKIELNKPDDEMGYTASHWAAKMDNVEVLQLLYNKSPTLLNAVSRTEDTALHIACMDQAEAAAEFLVSKGSSLNAPNLEGDTPLLLAIRHHLPNLVLKMLDTNAIDMESQMDLYGNSPLHIAREQNLYALSKLLESRGFKSTIKNRAGLTPNDITEHLKEQEERESSLKTAEKRNKEKKKIRERDQHMNNTEVTIFCKEQRLADLITVFYSKKIIFLDDYFLQLDAKTLKKIGLSDEQRDRFFAALKKREEEIEEQARWVEREQMNVQMRQRRWNQFFGLAFVAGAFIFIFFCLKLVAKYK